MKSIDVLPIQIFQTHYEQNEILNSFVNQKTDVWIDKEPDTFYPKSLDFEFEELPKDFSDFIRDSIEEFLFFQRIKYYEFKISLIWINIHNKKENRHRFHLHKNSIFSGVYYYETIKNDSLTFYDPDQEYQKYFDFVCDNMIFGERKTKVPITNGDVLFFRSDIMHGIERFYLNEGERRISISFNIDLNGIGSSRRKTFKK